MAQAGTKKGPHFHTDHYLKLQHERERHEVTAKPLGETRIESEEEKSGIAVISKGFMLHLLSLKNGFQVTS